MSEDTTKASAPEQPTRPDAADWAQAAAYSEAMDYIKNSPPGFEPSMSDMRRRFDINRKLGESKTREDLPAYRAAVADLPAFYERRYRHFAEFIEREKCETCGSRYPDICAHRRDNSPMYNPHVPPPIHGGMGAGASLYGPGLVPWQIREREEFEKQEEAAGA